MQIVDDGWVGVGGGWYGTGRGVGRVVCVLYVTLLCCVLERRVKGYRILIDCRDQGAVSAVRRGTYVTDRGVALLLYNGPLKKIWVCKIEEDHS